MQWHWNIEVVRIIGGDTQCKVHNDQSYVASYGDLQWLGAKFWGENEAIQCNAYELGKCYQIAQTRIESMFWMKR